MLIAHASDIHLLSLKQINPLAFLGKRLLGGANLLLNRGSTYPEEVARALVEDIGDVGPDHVVISGDLVNLSFPSEFELAREVLMSVPLPASDVTVVPGNHDCYTLGAALRDDFSRILRPFLRGDMTPGGGPFPFVRLRGDAAIVALSTARPSAPLLAVGSLGRRQLARAEELLAHPEVRARFRLVVLHHPPRVPPAQWHKRLTDGDAFAAMIRRAGADLIVHGHLHRPCRDALQGPDGPVPVIGVNSGTWIGAEDPERMASYNLYELSGSALRAVGSRRYDREARRFVAAG